MMAGLAALCAANAGAWHLAPIEERPKGFWAKLRGDTMPILSLVNDEPCFFAEHGPAVVAEGTEGPFVLPIEASTARVELQAVHFAVRRVPSRQTIQDMTRSLREILERALPA